MVFIIKEPFIFSNFSNRKSKPGKSHKSVLNLILFYVQPEEISFNLRDIKEFEYFCIRMEATHVRNIRNNKKRYAYLVS